MKYSIINYSEKIEVYDSQKLLFYVKRNLNWFGVRISKFYIDDKLFLETRYNSCFLKSKNWITFQNLESSLFIEKRNGIVSLVVNNNIYEYQSISFWKKQLLFKKNEEIVGRGCFYTESPISIGFFLNYDIDFDCSEMDAFYFLLLMCTTADFDDH